MKVPESLGAIQEIYTGARAETVILIQDAHEIPEAQRNIAKLIGYFGERYGIGRVALEGASGELDPQIFRSFPDAKRLREVMEEYYEAGELTGGTAAALLREELSVKSEAPSPSSSLRFTLHASPLKFQGIEDWRLYEEGIAAYQEAMAREQELSEALSVKREALREEKEKIYSREMLEMDEAVEKFYENAANLIETLKVLAKYRKPEGELALILKEVEKEEGRRKREERGGQKAEGSRRTRSSLDRDDAVLAQGRKGSIPLPEEIRRVWRQVQGAIRSGKVAPSEARELQQKYQQYQISEISAGEFALELQEIAERWGLSLSLSGVRPLQGSDPLVFSGALRRSMEEARKLRDLEGTKLMAAFETYMADVKREEVKREAQNQKGLPNRSSPFTFPASQIQALDSRTRELRLLTKLVRLELSRREWTELRTSYFVHRTSYLEHWKFYEISEDRERAFWSRLKGLLASRSTNDEIRSTILVAGGFHTDGLKERFKKEGISYAVVMPKISSVPEQTNYREHMKGNVSWKNYFRVENGRVNLYQAFVRGVRDRLLGREEQGIRGKKREEEGGKRNKPVDEGGRGPSSSPFFPFLPSSSLVKEWRDQILRDLAEQNRLAEAGSYTRFLDELIEKEEDGRGKREEGREKKNPPSSFLPLPSALLNPSHSLAAKVRARAERFISGLKGLAASKKLTDQNILHLLRSGMPSSTVRAGVLVPSENAMLQLPAEFPADSAVYSLPRTELRSKGPAVQTGEPTVPDPARDIGSPLSSSNRQSPVPDFSSDFRLKWLWHGVFLDDVLGLSHLLLALLVWIFSHDEEVRAMLPMILSLAFFYLANGVYGHLQSLDFRIRRSPSGNGPVSPPVQSPEKRPGVRSESNSIPLEIEPEDLKNSLLRRPREFVKTLLRDKGYKRCTVGVTLDPILKKPGVPDTIHLRIHVTPYRGAQLKPEMIKDLGTYLNGSFKRSTIEDWYDRHRPFYQEPEYEFKANQREIDFQVTFHRRAEGVVAPVESNGSLNETGSSRSEVRSDEAATTLEHLNAVWGVAPVITDLTPPDTKLIISPLDEPPQPVPGPGKKSTAPNQIFITYSKTGRSSAEDPDQLWGITWIPGKLPMGIKRYDAVPDKGLILTVQGGYDMEQIIEGVVTVELDSKRDLVTEQLSGNVKVIRSGRDLEGGELKLYSKPNQPIRANGRSEVRTLEPMPSVTDFAAMKRWIEVARRSIWAGAKDFENSQREWGELIDRVVQAVFEEAVREAGKEVRAHIALAADGSYGRGEMGSYSDADGRILAAPIPDSNRSSEEERIHQACKRLQEMTKKIFGCVWPVVETDSPSKFHFDGQLSDTDQLQRATALLDARWVAGSQAIYDATRQNFFRQISRPAQKTVFILTLLRAWDANYKKRGGYAGLYEDEPDLKDGFGGLRTLHFARWIAQAYSATPKEIPSGRELLESADRAGLLLTRAEIEEAKQAYSWMSRVQSALGFEIAESGVTQKTTKLTRPFREPTALRLGYQAGPEAGAGDQLLEEYRRHALVLFRISTQLMSRIAEQDKINPPQSKPILETPAGDDVPVQLVSQTGLVFQVESGFDQVSRARFLTLKADGRPLQPEDILPIFSAAIHYQASLGGDLRNAMEALQPGFEIKMQEPGFETRAQSALTEVIAQNQPLSETLLQAYSLGYLRSILRKDFPYQALRALRLLDDLLFPPAEEVSGESKRLHDMASGYLEVLRDRPDLISALRLALLYREVPRPNLDAMTFGPSQLQDAQWLLRERGKMVEMIRTEQLEDGETLPSYAEKEVHRLGALAYLQRNIQWRWLRRLIDLAVRILNVFLRLTMRDPVEIDWGGDYRRWVLLSVMTLMEILQFSSPRVWAFNPELEDLFRVQPEQIDRPDLLRDHLRRSYQQRKSELSPAPDDPSWQGQGDTRFKLEPLSGLPHMARMLVSHQGEDRPGLLLAIEAVLAAHELNVVTARVGSDRKGNLFDELYLEDPSSEDEPTGGEDRKWGRITDQLQGDLSRALKSPDEMLNVVRASRENTSFDYRRPSENLNAETAIEFKKAGEHSTRVVVRIPRRRHVPLRIGRVFLDYGIDIAESFFDAESGVVLGGRGPQSRAIYTFTVRKDGKFLSPVQQDQVEQALRRVLCTPSFDLAHSTQPDTPSPPSPRSEVRERVEFEGELLSARPVMGTLLPLAAQQGSGDFRWDIERSGFQEALEAAQSFIRGLTESYEGDLGARVRAPRAREKGLLFWAFPETEAQVFRKELEDLSRRLASPPTGGDSPTVEHPLMRLISMIQTEKEKWVLEVQRAYERRPDVPDDFRSKIPEYAEAAVRELQTVLLDRVHIQRDQNVDSANLVDFIGEHASRTAAEIEARAQRFKKIEELVAKEEQKKIRLETVRKNKEAQFDKLRQLATAAGGFDRQKLISEILALRFGDYLQAVENLLTESPADPDLLRRKGDWLQRQQELRGRLEQAGNLPAALEKIEAEIRAVKDQIGRLENWLKEYGDARKLKEAAEMKAGIYQGFPGNLAACQAQKSKGRTDSLGGIFYEAIVLSVMRVRKEMAPDRWSDNFDNWTDSALTGQAEIREWLLSLQGSPEEATQAKRDSGASYILVVPEGATDKEVSRALDRYGPQIRGIVGVGATKTIHWVALLRSREYVPPILILSSRPKIDLMRQQGTAAMILPGGQGRKDRLVLDPQTGDREEMKKKEIEAARLNRAQQRMMVMTPPIPIALNIDVMHPGRLKRPAGLIRTDVISTAMDEAMGNVAQAIGQGEFLIQEWFSSIRDQISSDSAALRGLEPAGEVIQFLSPQAAAAAEGIHAVLDIRIAAMEQSIGQAAFAGKDIPLRTLDLQPDSKNKDTLKKLEDLAALFPDSGLRRNPSLPITGFNFYQNSDSGELQLVLDLAAQLIAYRHATRGKKPEEIGRLVPLFPLISTHEQFCWIYETLWPLAQKVAVWRLASQGEVGNAAEMAGLLHEIEETARDVKFGIMVEYVELLKGPEMDKFMTDPRIVRFNVGNNDLFKDYAEKRGGQTVSREEAAFAATLDELHQELMKWLEIHLLVPAAQHGKRVCFCGGVAEAEKFLGASEFWRRRGLADFSVSVTAAAVPGVNHAQQVFRSVRSEDLTHAYDPDSHEPELYDARAQEVAERFVGVSKAVSISAESWQESYAAMGFHHALYRSAVDPVNGIGGLRKWAFLKDLIRTWLTYQTADLDRVQFSKEETATREEVERMLHYLADRGMMIRKKIPQVLAAYDLIHSVERTYQELQRASPEKFTGVLYPAVMPEFIQAWAAANESLGADWLPRPSGSRAHGDLASIEKSREETFMHRLHNASADVFYTVRRALHQIEGGLVRPIYTEERVLRTFQGSDGTRKCIKLQKRVGLTMSRDRGRVGESAWYLHVEDALESLRQYPEMVYEIYALAAEHGVFISHRVQWAIEELNLEENHAKRSELRANSPGGTMAETEVLQEPERVRDFKGLMKKLLPSNNNIRHVFWRLHEYKHLKREFPFFSKLSTLEFKNTGGFTEEMQVLRVLEMMELLYEEKDGFIFERAGAVFQDIRSHPDQIRLARLAVLLQPIVRVEAGEHYSREAVRRVTQAVLQGLGMEDPQLVDQLVWVLFYQHRFREDFMLRRDLMNAIEEIARDPQVTTTSLEVLYVVLFASQAAEANPESQGALTRFGSDSPLANLDRWFVACEMIRNQHSEVDEAYSLADAEVVWNSSDRQVLTEQLDRFIREDAWEEVLNDYLKHSGDAQDPDLREVLTQVIKEPGVREVVLTNLCERTSHYYLRTLDPASLLRWLFFCRHLNYLRENRQDFSTRVTAFFPLPGRDPHAYEVVIGSARDEFGTAAIYSRTLYENGFYVENAAIHVLDHESVFIRFIGTFAARGESGISPRDAVVRDLGQIFNPGRGVSILDRDLLDVFRGRFALQDRLYGGAFQVGKEDAWVGPPSRVQFLEDAEMYEKIDWRGGLKRASFLTVDVDSSSWRGQLAVILNVLSRKHGLMIYGLKSEENKGLPPRTVVCLTDQKGQPLIAKKKNEIITTLQGYLDMKPVDFGHGRKRRAVRPPSLEVTREAVQPRVEEAVIGAPASESEQPPLQKTPADLRPQSPEPPVEVAASAIETKEVQLTVVNKLGIHARPASMFVRAANEHLKGPENTVHVEKDGEVVDGKQIMGLMMLAAGPGSVIRVKVTASPAARTAFINALLDLEDDPNEKIVKLRAELRILNAAEERRISESDLSQTRSVDIQNVAERVAEYFVAREKKELGMKEFEQLKALALEVRESVAAVGAEAFGEMLFEAVEAEMKERGLLTASPVLRISKARAEAVSRRIVQRMMRALSPDARGEIAFDRVMSRQAVEEALEEMLREFQLRRVILPPDARGFVRVPRGPSVEFRKPADIRARHSGLVPVAGETSVEPALNRSSFFVGLEDADDFRDEPYLQVVEKVLQIAGGLLLADKAKTLGDLQNPEIQAALLKDLFQGYSQADQVIRFHGRGFTVQAAALAEFILQAQMDREIQRAA